MVDFSAHVIFCDDIRVEANGKFILIGVYAGGMLLHNVPGNVSIGTYIELIGLPTGSHHLSIRVDLGRDNDAELIGSMETDIDVRDGSAPVVLHPTGLPIAVTKADSLFMLIAVNGGEMKRVAELKITAASPQ